MLQQVRAAGRRSASQWARGGGLLSARSEPCGAGLAGRRRVSQSAVGPGSSFSEVGRAGAPLTRVTPRSWAAAGGATGAAARCGRDCKARRASPFLSRLPRALCWHRVQEGGTPCVLSGRGCRPGGEFSELSLLRSPPGRGGSPLCVRCDPAGGSCSCQFRLPSSCRGVGSRLGGVARVRRVFGAVLLGQRFWLQAGLQVAWPENRERGNSSVGRSLL